MSEEYKKTIYISDELTEAYKDIKGLLIKVEPDFFNGDKPHLQKGYELILREQKRTKKQNKLYHALFNDIADHLNLESKYTFNGEDIKDNFYKEIGWINEIEYLGITKIEKLKTSKNLSKSEMIEHIDFLKEWAFVNCGKCELNTEESKKQYE